MGSELLLEKVANAFRSDNRIGSEDPIRLKSLLSRLNVITVFRPLGSEFSGMAVKITDSAEAFRFMLVNSNHSLGKQHFTICHELYHLFIQKEFSSRRCITGLFDVKDKVEYQADIFAAYLLLPENGILGLIPNEELAKNKISLKTLLKIEQYYSCSRGALLFRLKSLKLIDGIKYNEFNTGIKKSALTYGYGTDLYEPGNENQFLGDYGSIANELFQKELISESHYMSLLLDLGLDELDIEKLFNGQE
ncbi:ImmA/IrrE family metallo-endopeptidase [Aquiflexum sp. TKW24L]|uniref:ImmA/IrrE family metallo-endopeptidase n=1 Tax=Aquiflexum sp. TKW24L TaxID=2942212 RepID=UPI0020BEF902|nr:ImmA/IrrE family metallo-endopeptidase [Aquiflexum sp. TKW24L]MCL6261585.1 ImmA/IrrE family metallo-endopeptidase [Aquiflexum sp. TKW24L]